MAVGGKLLVFVDGIPPTANYIFMKITKEVQEKSQTQLTIEVSWEDFQPYVEKATKKIAEQVDIPGFRKGQAPFDMLAKKVGEMAIYQEAVGGLVEKVLPEAIEKEGLNTVGQPSINIEKLAKDNPVVFTAVCPIMPETTVGDVSAITAKKEAIEVNNAEIEKVIENLQKMRAKEVLADREAKKDDKVDISFNVFLDGVPVDGGQADKYPMVIGEGQMIPGFEDNVIGMKKDEEKEFELEFPKDYHNKQLGGKKAEFKVKLLAVYDRELPELNAEFAKEVGDFESVDAMKDSIEKNIHEEKEQKVNNKFEREIIESLVEASTFGDIPDVMVNQEVNQMMQELERNLAQQGLQFDDYLQHLKKDRNQLKLDFTPDAVKRIKSALVIRALAEQEKIEATKEEIDAELDKMKEMYKINPQFLQQIETPAYREYITTIQRNKKTLEWLKEKVGA